MKNPNTNSSLIQSFILNELFGVDFTGQVLTLPLENPCAVDPDNCCLIDESDKDSDKWEEIPYQILSDKKLAIFTKLPAGGTKIFRLYSGKSPGKFAGTVQMSKPDGKDYIELTNGLTGVRVLADAPCKSRTKAPVCGILLADGVTWTPPGTDITFGDGGSQGTLKSADDFKVTIKENGPIRVQIEASYVLSANACYNGAYLIYPECSDFYYKTTVTLDKGQPSVMFETETNISSEFSMSLYDGIAPNQLRFHGHHATEPKYGHRADGSCYPIVNNRGNEDALTVPPSAYE